MRYLIANAVIYDSEAGVLSAYDDPETEEKKLTPTANRILRLLIESYGRAVAREELLTNVWESQGQTASNSSLNQYVSILRKTFATFSNLDGVIVSVPRLGFTISDCITVEALPEEAQEPAPMPIPEPVLIPATSVPPQKGRQWGWVTNLLLLVACSVFGLSLYVAKHHSDALYENTIEFGKLDKCTLYAYTKLPVDVAHRIQQSLDDIDPELPHKCQQRNAKVIFSAQRMVYYGEEGKIFMAYCPQEDEESVFYCSNKYFYNRVLK
ncbi:winged helix-turn-helix domain-containing protein [Aeromonas simiae]|uniref:winged helix-turn-helix domain-containing protein n=1 Tax=Aeromonas simiae TaxID=218936 RepID=UPI0006942235|nr:winged helix-turn-helix domain-containing protein [Aeromonas simiae]